MAKPIPWRLLLAVLLTISLLTGFVRTAEAQDLNDPAADATVGQDREYKFRGFMDQDALADRGGNRKPALYVSENLNDELTHEDGTLAYCFNLSRAFPPHGDVTDQTPKQSEAVQLYKEVISSEAEIKEHAENPRDPATLKQNVLSVILNGFNQNVEKGAHNAIQKRFGLSNREFYRVTQAAIWFYTDSAAANSFSDAAVEAQLSMQQAYFTLLGQTDAPVLAGVDSVPELKPVPGEMALHLYVAKNRFLKDGWKEYQNLLSAVPVDETGEPLVEEPVVPAPANPEILGTTVTVPSNSDKVLAAEGGKVVDTVEYKGLNIGEPYVVVGELMEKGKNGETVVTNIKARSAEFRPTATNTSDTVNVEFDVPAGWHNRTMVVFERLYKADTYGNPVGEPIAVHEDIMDEKQTFTIADADNPITLGTVAKDKADEDKSVESGGTIVDTVTYTGLKPNTQYTLIAMLVKKEGFVPTGDPQPVDVKNQTFTTSDDPDGFVDVELTAPTVDEDSEYVVFEYLFEGVVNPESGDGSGDQKFIKSHDDINDAGQTVTVTAPEVPGVPEVPEIPDTNGSSKWGWIIALIVGVVGLIGLSSNGSSGSSGSSTPDKPKTPKPDDKASKPESKTPGKDSPSKADKPSQKSPENPAPQGQKPAPKLSEGVQSAQNNSRGISADTGVNIFLAVLALMLMSAAGFAAALRRRNA